MLCMPSCIISGYSEQDSCSFAPFSSGTNWLSAVASAPHNRVDGLHRHIYILSFTSSEMVSWNDIPGSSKSLALDAYRTRSLLLRA
jgi:hypothetical protein